MIDTQRHKHKDKREQIILSIFSSFFSLSPFLLFRVVVAAQKRNRGEKKKEAAHRPTSLSVTPPYAKLPPSCFAIRSLTYIYIIYQLRLLRCRQNFITLITASYSIFSSQLLTLHSFTIISLSTVSSQHLSSYYI
jgi:hypothetical protein